MTYRRDGVTQCLQGVMAMASINYAVGNNWGSGFVGNMTVPGGDQGLNGWTIEFDASFAISNIWGAEIVSHVGNHYVIRNLDWNATVPAGGQASFGFQATPGTGGTAATGLVIDGAAVTPPPPSVLPTLSIGDASITEGNSGTSLLAFTVQLSQAATGPVTVHYATADGTATAGSDYTAGSGTLTFAAGETSKTISVPIIGDTVVEANETFSIALSGASGATIAQGSAVGTIVDDVAAPPPPPPAGGAVLDYAVDSNWGSGFTGAMTVTAGSGGLSGWTVTFDASATITSIWNADIVSHVGNHYVVSNAAWNGQVAGGQAVSFGFQATPGSAGTTASGFTINGVAAGHDPVPPPPVLPSLSVADASVTEGNGGTSDLAFTVTLSAAATGPVTVAYATADGTATAGSDYAALAGTLSFAAGETSKVVHVQITGDTVVEANETLTLSLSSPNGATIAHSTATGTIVDDVTAPLPTLSIGDSSFSEGSAAVPGHGSFSVTLSAAATAPVTVHFATADGTAGAGSDYVAQSGTLTFAPGETQKTITVAAIGEGTVEASEGFTVTLANPTGATIAHGTGSGTIVNDVAPPPPLPTLSISDTSVVEGNPGGSTAAPGWLSTSGNQIVDSAGHSVQIAGVNWFGFESTNMSPDGLWTRGYKDMMDQMVQLGFNTIRLPFSSEMLHSTAAPSGIDFSKNPDLQGLSALQIMDKIVGYADQIGLKIILDHHRSEAGDGTSANGLWYDAQHSQAEWVSDWQMLAQRYAGNPAVIGADLHNEPYNGTWGDGGPNDWVAAAEQAGNAIGTVNPNWLVFVEGIGTYQGQSYWWGGNLMGVKDHPVVLDVPNKLVYSPHDYPDSVYQQPWFSDPSYPANLPAKFTQMWGYIYQQGIAPVYLGEFGTKLVDPKDAPWLQAITHYLSGDFNNDGKSDIPAGKQGVSWTFWSWNPNSGDTGGILADDWNTVNQAKLAYLTPIEFNLGSAGTGSATVNAATFVLTLSQPATGAVTVDFHTVAGDATSGTDFTDTSGSVTFAAGEQSKTISIPITADTASEPNEHFTVVLSNAQGATITRATGTATIVDDVAPPVTPPVTPPVVPPTTPPPASSDLSGQFAATDTWSGGFNADVTVHNGGAAAAWQIAIDMPYQITNIWNGTIVSHDANGYVIAGAAWNGQIAHDGQTDFGFTASGQLDASTVHVHAVGPATADVVPNAPTGLAAAATSSSSTLLSWNASTVPGSGSVSGYAIFEDGHQLATTTDTHYTVAGLTADTSYQFTVAAMDAAGSSAQATPVAVHTTVPGADLGGAATIFSPYIDMAMTQDDDLVAISHASGIQNFTLAFMLASDHGIGWQGAGAITDDTLVNGTTILSQVQAIQAAGGNITISFGGAAGQEAALTAPSAAVLQAEYQSVIDRYHINSIDFDIEGAAEQNQHSITLRDQAIVGLQAANPDLKVSFTLPVLPTGLDASGLAVLQSAKHDGVRIDTVNIMTMDYGQSVDNNGQMGQDAINAAIATEKQLADLGMTAKIGITPLIGVNDIASEVFTLADAQALVNYAKTDPHVAELSMWSVARDNGNSAGAHFSSPDSSGIAQQPFEFSGILHHFDHVG
jgi:aryl-phospho-beta-D-glucosidase BglC (GH1 family)/cellulase/cellobiase CelA1